MRAEAADNRRIPPPVYFLVALILMVCLHLVLPGPQVLASPLRYIGWPVVVAAISLVLWATGLFRKAGTTIKPFQESSVLVLGGPYRLSRNPIYAGLVSALLGIGLLLGSVSPFVVVPVFVALIDLRFIRAEEAVLERRFGAAYRAYKARVRRWL